jgi:alkylhydroperoxidase/carboxymuconolactone decarboxylase family protein YurZ
LENYRFKDYENDGLTFLMSSRKDVVKSYQNMLNKLGTHLEDKTRELIVLALQVTTQQPEAINILIPKALKAGASPDEIIDAVTLAIPNVGLTGVLKLLPIILDELRKYDEMVKPEN